MLRHIIEDAASLPLPTHRRTSRRCPGILIADDMALILALLRIELEERGFSIWLATDGKQALGLYRENRQEIDLVLLDVQMPHLDGPQTLAAIREIDPFILACFMTAGTTLYTDEDLLDRGAACLIRKPFHINQVVDMLGRLIGGLSCAAAPAASDPLRGSPRLPR